MKRRGVLLLCLGLATNLAALTWVNTGNLDRALYVYDVVQGPGGWLYAPAKIDTASPDSGWVFFSQDLFNWQRGGDLPGDVKNVPCLISGGGDTLWAGAKLFLGAADSGGLYLSTNRGANWQLRSQLRATRVGNSITALLEDRNGVLHAGTNYSGMTGYPPCRSTDQGLTWLQGPSTAFNAYHYCLLEATNGALHCGTWATGAIPLKSTDGGATWPGMGSMYDAGHSTTIIEGTGGVLYAGTYPKTAPAEPIGRVFRSTDEGANWIQIGYGYFNSTSGIRSLCLTRDGSLYAGSAPSAEVFVSTDGGGVWTSAGQLTGATVVYRLREAVKADSVFLFAATGPNGDVFRAFLFATSGTEEASGLGQEPRSFLAVYPNPFRGQAQIRFLAPGWGEARVAIYDVTGRLAREFGPLAKGVPTTLSWDGRDQAGREVQSGVYFFRLTATGFTATQKVILAR